MGLLGAEEWVAGANSLGRGRFDPANVRAGDDGVRLVLPAGRLDGGQVVSAGRYAEGRFRAEVRVARAAGSLSALFLYEDVPGEANDELDVEVFGDGSRRVLLTAWVDGVRTRSAEHLLPFDPHDGVHEYGFDWRPGEARLVVDGRVLEHWSDGVPRRPMRLMANAWWPRWLEGGAPAEERWTLLARVRVEAWSRAAAP